MSDDMDYTYEQPCEWHQSAHDALAAMQPTPPEWEIAMADALEAAYVRGFGDGMRAERQRPTQPVDKSDALDDAFARLLGDTPHARPQDG